MIEKNEVLNISRNLGLRPDTIEKDYILGWMLDGINQNSTTTNWAFKGGTSLKKCFFDTFRFSEDLDFTLTNNTHLDENFLLDLFKDICANLSDKTGIIFYPERFKFKIIEKNNGLLSAQGKIHFNGPLSRTQGVATIKLDLTTDEVLVMGLDRRRVQHPYTDEPEEFIHINCYSFEEVVAEKIRALAQRIRPRDLYDVVHFFRNREMITNPMGVIDVLRKKCEYKEMDVPTFADIESHEKLNELEPQWENMLAHQLPSLPPMDTFWDDLCPFFDWLNGILDVEELPQSPMVSGDVFNVDRNNLYQSDLVGLNKVQFAAANRLCILMIYSNKQRTIEPISFRTANNGNRLFYGYEREAGHVKAFSID